MRIARGADRILARPDLPRAVALDWLERGIAALPPGGSRASADSAVGPLFLKRDERARPWRPSRALRAFRIAAALEEEGVPAPRAWAVLARGGERWLVLEELEGRDLGRVLAEGAPGDAICASVAELVARLHRAGFRQRDLKASNLLCSETGGRSLVRVLDLDGVARVARPAPARLRAKDLGRLGASFLAARCPPDRWRELLRAYLARFEEREPAESDVDAWCERTMRRARAKARRNARRGRPLG